MGLWESVLRFFLPYDWLESNNQFYNELKEGEKKKSSLSQLSIGKHTSCLLAEPVGPTDFFST